MSRKNDSSFKDKLIISETDDVLFYFDLSNSHEYERGYIDANGKYKFWVQYKEDGYNIGESGDLYYNEKYVGTNIGMYVQEFSFNRDFSDSFYSIVIVDKDNNHIEDDNNPDNPYENMRKLFNEEGKIIFASDEVKKRIEEHRQEIGFSDELYYYGSDLEP